MKITLYTSPHCKWSTRAKEFLKKKKVEFTEKDVIDDVERQHNKYRKEMIDKTSQLTTPVLDAEGILVIGFNEKDYLGALEKAKKIEKIEEE